jgi:CubicO group peptidase (beta-lactamase class C family)
VFVAVTLLVTGALATGSIAAASGVRRQGDAKSLASDIDATIKDSIDENHLAAVIVRVTENGKNLFTRAYGESMNGVPATTDMHFRNGAVSISYVANLLLQLVDQKKIRLDDKLQKYLPDLPNCERVTVGQLATMTSGYADFVQNPDFISEHYADVFRKWTPQDLIDAADPGTLLYEPGTGWSYAHTNYVILGLVIEKATGQKMSSLLDKRVLGPLGLDDTTDPGTPEIQEPALHAGSSERREFLELPDTTPFFEDSTYWDPSWSITRGAIETSNIFDLDKTAIAVGTGKLLSPASHKAMVSKERLGLGENDAPGCPTCHKLDDFYNYGIGVVLTGDWLMQNPAMSGYVATEAYLPSKKIAISVAVTYAPEAYEAEPGSGSGAAANQADVLFRAIGKVVVPDDAPPTKTPS